MTSSRESTSIKTVIETLKKREKSPEIKEVTFGVGSMVKQTFTTVDGVIAYRDDQGNLILPSTASKRLQTIAAALKLLDSELNTQSSDPSQWTVLIKAIHDNDLQLVKLLLDHGADPSVADSEGNNAFMHAANLGQGAILLELLTVIANEPQPSSSASNSHKTEEDKSAANAPKKSTASISTITATSSSQSEEAQAPKGTAVKLAQKSEEKSPSRIRLDAKVLKHKNIKEETAEQLILQCTDKLKKNKMETGQEACGAKAQKIAGKQPEKASKKNQNELERLKQYAEELHKLNPNPPPSRKSTDLSTAGPTQEKQRTPAQEATDNKAQDAAIRAKREAALQAFDGFYNRKCTLFAATRGPLEEQDYRTQKEAAKKRERQREQHGLILLLATKKEVIETETLRQLSHAHQDDPILIRETVLVDSCYDVLGTKNQYSIYGYSSQKGWQLTRLEDFQAAYLDKYNALQSKFTELAESSAKAISIPHDDAFLWNKIFISDSPEISSPTLMGMISLGHCQNLSDKEHVFPGYEDGNQDHLPVSHKDQSSIQAALALLRDYYAPESAPLPHCILCGPLRRLLTFNLGRRYCTEAENLYNQYGEKHFAQLSAVKDLHTKITAEYKRVSELDFDKKSKNTIHNSAYTQRLFYILQILEKTAAYRQVLYPQTTAFYLKGFDREYVAHDLRGGIPGPCGDNI